MCIQGWIRSRVASPAPCSPCCVAPGVCPCACCDLCQVADTVLVQPGGAAPQVLTAQAPKEWDKISYTLDKSEELVSPSPSAAGCGHLVVCVVVK
jgi:hypothetical protein